MHTIFARTKEGFLNVSKIIEPDEFQLVIVNMVTGKNTVIASAETLDELIYQVDQLRDILNEIVDDGNLDKIPAATGLKYAAKQN